MDSDTLTITLPVNDWQLIQVALGELQAKFAIPVMGRLQAALNAAQNPPEKVPENLKIAEAAE